MAKLENLCVYCGSSDRVDPLYLELAEQLASNYTVALLTNNVSLVQESLNDIAPDVVRIFGANAHT